MSDVPNEKILDGDYPMYGDYWYVVDGKPVRSDWHDVTVDEYKRRTGAKEIRRCNIAWRASHPLPVSGKPLTAWEKYRPDDLTDDELAEYVIQSKGAVIL